MSLNATTIRRRCKQSESTQHRSLNEDQTGLLLFDQDNDDLVNYNVLNTVP